MKTLSHLLLLAAATYSANASTINFASNATSVDASQNNSVGPNVVIDKNPGWVDPIAGSKWISYGSTGNPSSAGFFSPANGTIVSFFQTFNLTAGDLTANGKVSLLADDSAATVLNGHVLMTEASMVGNTYSTCSDTQPNCQKVTTIVLPSSFLVAGANTLRFDVAQRAGSSFGLDYSGTVGAPEPATWAFMGTGALLIGLGVRKRSLANTNV